MTTKKTSKFHAIPCPGEAHSNPHIDNCMLCAPLWGKIVLPVECETLEDWQNLSEETQKWYQRGRKAYAKKLQANKG